MSKEAQTTIGERGETWAETERLASTGEVLRNHEYERAILVRRTDVWGRAHYFVQLQFVVESDAAGEVFEGEREFPTLEEALQEFAERIREHDRVHAEYDRRLFEGEDLPDTPAAPDPNDDDGETPW